MKKYEHSWMNRIAIVALIAAVCAIPFFIKIYQLDLMIAVFINIIVVASFRYLSLTGEMSFGHVVIMGVGAYTSAILSKFYGIPPWITLPLGGVMAAFVAYVLSFPLFRMKGFYFVIGSFAAGEAIRLCWLAFRGLFGGSQGVTVIPSMEIAGIDFMNPMPYYYFSFVVMLICLAIMYRLEHSRYGLTLHAVHWRDVLVESVGVNARGVRVQAFVVASFFAGIGGGMYAHYFSAINPRDFALTIMLSVLVWAIVGGLGFFSGPIIGVVVLSLVDTQIRDLEQYRPLAYGLILIFTSLFIPEGLASLPDKFMQLTRRILGKVPTGV